MATWKSAVDLVRCTQVDDAFPMARAAVEWHPYGALRRIPTLRTMRAGGRPHIPRLHDTMYVTAGR